MKTISLIDAKLSRAGLLALFCLFMLSACSERINLQTGLADSDANEIVALLNRSGIDAKKQLSKEGVALTVKEADISRATEAMLNAGLPRRKLSNLGTIFKKEGMISTPLEERVRYIHGLSSELETTLQQFDNVISARVHVVLPERIAPGEPIQPSSAAVFVKYQVPFDVDAAIPRMRNLVASSIPGLANETGKSKVSVVLVPVESSHNMIEWVAVGPFQVQADTANSLRATLWGLCLLALMSLGCAIAAILANKPQALNWFKQGVEKMSAFNPLDYQAKSKKEESKDNPAI